MKEHLASISNTCIYNKDLDSSTYVKVSLMLLTSRKTDSGYSRSSSTTTIIRVYRSKWVYVSDSETYKLLLRLLLLLPLQSVERVTPGEEALGSIPTVAVRSLLGRCQYNVTG